MDTSWFSKFSQDYFTSFLLNINLYDKRFFQTMASSIPPPPQIALKHQSLQIHLVYRLGQKQRHSHIGGQTRLKWVLDLSILDGNNSLGIKFFYLQPNGKKQRTECKI